MIKILEYIFSGILMSGFYLYTISTLTKRKIDFKNKKIYMHCIFLAIVMFINYYFLVNKLKILVITIAYILFNNICFKDKIKISLLNALFYQLLVMISEAVFTIIMTLIFKDKVQDIFNNYCGVFLINFLIVLICFLILKLKFIRSLYNYFQLQIMKISERLGIVLLFLMIFSVTMLFPVIYYRTDISYFVIINTFLTCTYMFIIIKILNEKNKYIEINEKYNSSLKSIAAIQEAVDILKINNHENKNQLLVIRNMIKKNDKTTINYIDALLDNKIKDDEKLFIDISSIKNSSISSIVYSKILYMKSRNIDVTLSIDKMIRKQQISMMKENMTVDICKILGVLLDNAIEAVEKLNDREIGIYFFVDDNSKINIEISNKYSDTIDINNIEDCGYTTKGEGHGYGLSLVRTIIDSNNNLKLITEIQGNIFKQTLVIDKY